MYRTKDFNGVVDVNKEGGNQICALANDVVLSNAQLYIFQAG